MVPMKAKYDKAVLQFAGAHGIWKISIAPWKESKRFWIQIEMPFLVRKACIATTLCWDWLHPQDLRTNWYNSSLRIVRYNESDEKSRKKRNRKREGCSKAKANYHPSTDAGDLRSTLFSCVHTGLIRHCSSSSDEEQCEKSAGLILYISWSKR